MELVIDVKNLSKKYGSHEAVKGISFEVKKGALFAFLGTNGAGKSTSIEMLCTLLEKTLGDVKINGVTLGSRTNNYLIRKAIGVVFQQSILDARLTVKENILHRGNIYNLTKKELQENWGFVDRYLHLEDIAKKKYGTLSGGQKRRADIARAIIHKPTILFLDEPTTGLDPQTRVFVWDAIKKLQEETNMTIFLTTHYMEEAAVADEIVVMKEGKIVSKGTPNTLKEQYTYDELFVFFNNGVDGSSLLTQNNLNFEEKNGEYRVRVQSTIHALDILKELQTFISSFEVKKGSMDDVFIRINEEVPLT
ncbi:ATP-binding cassette domain-containing protein [Lysinibacillus sp. CNPSo 3705]|uniref:ABC transporter ATP-binding protein n=1 Tax=Lysinibacillus sp. CNPSo 3705 TaxID=3028148 RepID=UPI0023649D17|nr:ATP-binding cassette domain-containing protein [Lysinibacillus sp. CNPSo 3705]MDD1502127.1 ATP-binding cassette domain-containing protein [Lysinibacillus sp. CNPSo 3705]